LLCDKRATELYAPQRQEEYQVLAVKQPKQGGTLLIRADWGEWVQSGFDSCGLAWCGCRAVIRSEWEVTAPKLTITSLVNRVCIHSSIREQAGPKWLVGSLEF
jgi:hypothetical protein